MFLKKYLPTTTKLKKNPTIRWLISWFGNRPYLWSVSKHSFAAGVAISFFVAFLPLPFEMLIVTLLSIWLHANLVISLISTWITNPFTLVPANYLCYQVGVWILRDTNSQFTPPQRIYFHWNNWSLLISDFSSLIGSLSKAYFIGLPIVSISVGLISYGLVYGIWSTAELFTRKKK